MPGKATLFATLLACAALAGCADHKLSEQSLAKAQSEFDQVRKIPTCSARRPGM